MTLGAVSGSDSSSAVSVCSCCGVKMVPYFSHDALLSNNQINQLISESFLTVKGAALFLPRGNTPTPDSAPCISQRRNNHTGDLQKHLETMFTVLRPEDTIKLAVRLESSSFELTRYMVVVSNSGRHDTEESIVLGMDFVSSDSFCTVGLVLPLWSDTMIHLDGDGGFSVSTVNRVHVFKPVSVQAMWSALQSLHKACDVARCHNYYPGSLFLTWVSYYQSRISSNQFCINEWSVMQDVESHRANSPILFTDLPTEGERTERLIKQRLREIMMQKDLENVTCKEIRTELEMQMVCNLREFKEFIDNEMIVILGQMDSPTEIFEHVYLGSEWNASNLEELQNSGVHYILNVTREIDNFFPGTFEYHNIRVYDEEATNLLEYWNDTYKFISKARKAGSKCLVHCKMGISRSASTVIAYAMKEYGWDLDTALEYVKEKRAVTKPNPAFMKQLEEYQGILLASKQRHNKLWRSHSDSDLSESPESLCKPTSRCPGHPDSHNNNSSSPSLPNFLGVAVLQAPEVFTKSNPSHTPDSHTDSTCVFDSPHRDDMGTNCGETLPFPLPDPQADTLVPEENLDNPASVAVSVSPPSLHTSPTTPGLPSSHQGRPTELSLTLPQHKTVTEQSSSDETSGVTLESTDSDIIDQSNVMTDKQSPISPESISSSSSGSSFFPRDNNNNTSELQTGSELYTAEEFSQHNTDNINFFSAREKFQCRAKYVRSRTLSEHTQQRIPPSLEENGVTETEEEELGNRMSQTSEQSEDSIDKDISDPTRLPHHDNGVSVRHIVTEMEAICHPACYLPAPSCSSSQSPQLRPGNQMEAETSEITKNSLTPPSQPQAPSVMPCDWPAGSVRRATEQLEQKLKQETEMAVSQRSPHDCPGVEHTPVRLSLCSENPPPCFPQRSIEKTTSEGEDTAEYVERKDGERETEIRTEIQSPDSSIKDPSYSPISDISKMFGALPQPEEFTKNTSAQSQRRSRLPTRNQQAEPSPQACSYLVTLDVMTVEKLDSSSQGGQGALGPGYKSYNSLSCGSQELELIQQTLRELQAFLHEGVSVETTDSPEEKVGNVIDTEPGLCKGTSSEQNPPGLHVRQCHRERREGGSVLEPTGWYRAVELEARIRHAGLTAPSLMKRSASLAKLDCLELSADDLSDLEPRSLISTTSSPSKDSLPFSPSHPDDTWKKQKVWAQNTLSHTGRDLDDLSSSPSSCLPSTTHPNDDTSRREEQDSSGSVSVTSTRTQGRGHSSRRCLKASAERKQQPVTLLYNTM
ncbi:protein phosphatase Slingshot homolog 2 isoform X1 [Labrus bergylta]|uniref:protein phosphatase Slingshot homolog 2 isoform X1 n=2 Tax=Labrus bergylta TaxID=56723 RepID=UPI0009B3009E|nr:protein phosphatase Slingshot homolog 2 [Labrus bergylta]